MKKILVVICAIILTGCMSNPGKFNANQIKALQANGFVQSDDNWALDINSKILFDKNKTELSQAAIDKVKHVATVLAGIGITVVQFDGYTDNLGSSDYNATLSEQRASQVSKLFEQVGFKPNLLKVRGLGASNPVQSNDTEEGRSENRRVTIIVIQ